MVVLACKPSARNTATAVCTGVPRSGGMSTIASGGSSLGDGSGGALVSSMVDSWKVIEGVTIVNDPTGLLGRAASDGDL